MNGVANQLVPVFEVCMCISFIQLHIAVHATSMDLLYEASVVSVCSSH